MNDERRKKVVFFLIRWNFGFAKFAEATVRSKSHPPGWSGGRWNERRGVDSRTSLPTPGGYYLSSFFNGCDCSHRHNKRHPVFSFSHTNRLPSSVIMWFLLNYPRWQQPSLSPASLPPSLRSPLPAPRSLTTPTDPKEDQNRRPPVVYERSPESDLSVIPSSKPHLLHSPWIGDQVDADLIPLPLSKVAQAECRLQVPLKMVTDKQTLLLDFAVKSQTRRRQIVTCEEGVPPEVPLQSQTPLEVVTCEGIALASPLGFPVKSKAPLEVVTGEKGVLTLPRGTFTKSLRAVHNKTPSTFWVVMFLFLINVLPSLILAQINVTEYVAFVGGTDTVSAAVSNTPPNVFPGARDSYAGFYERSQKCYYSFGGYNGGNREMIVILTFLSMRLFPDRSLRHSCTPVYAFTLLRKNL